MRTLERIDNALARLEGWLIIIFLGAMVVLTFVQVCLRGLYTHAHLQWPTPSWDTSTGPNRW